MSIGNDPIFRRLRMDVANSRGGIEGRNGGWSLRLLEGTDPVRFDFSFMAE